jgi:hypothetical protein
MAEEAAFFGDLSDVFRTETAKYIGWRREVFDPSNLLPFP